MKLFLILILFYTSYNVSLKEKIKDIFVREKENFSDIIILHPGNKITRVYFQENSVLLKEDISLPEKSILIDVVIFSERLREMKLSLF